MSITLNSPLALNQPASSGASRKPRLVISANATMGVGGQGLNLKHMAEYLASAFEIELFSQRQESDKPSHRVEGSSLARFLWSKPVLRRLRDWSTFHHNLAFDRAVAARLPPDAVLLHCGAGHSLNTLRAARKLGYRTVLDVTTLHVEDLSAAMRVSCSEFGIRPPLHRWEVERTKEEYREADLIRVMSKAAAESFYRRGFPPDRIVITSPPFDTDEFPRATLDEPVFRICYVGLLEPWKGFHHLVEAFSRLEHRRAELIFWGGSGSRPVASFLAKARSSHGNIIVRPMEIRKAGLGEVYGRASVLVLPSLADGFGYVVGEALASGLPVVTTTTTGACELVEDGKNGFVINPGDTRALTERLSWLANDGGLLKRMGEAALETMRGRPSAASLGSQYSQRLLQLLKDRG